MRGIARRTWAAGLATMTLAAGLGACTVGESGDGKDDRATAKACSDGTYAWSGVRRTQKLTALADPITFERKTASYSARLKPVGDTVYRPSVTGAPRGVGAGDVIKALGTRLKAEEPLAGPSETERPEEDHYFEAATGDLKGSYYSWGWIDQVEADFTYTCGSGKPATGHVLTWEGTGTGFMSCTNPAEGTAAGTAARETCPGGSVAAKAAT